MRNMLTRYVTSYLINILFAVFDDDKEKKKYKEEATKFTTSINHHDGYIRPSYFVPIRPAD